MFLPSRIIPCLWLDVHAVVYVLHFLFPFPVPTRIICPQNNHHGHRQVASEPPNNTHFYGRAFPFTAPTHYAPSHLIGSRGGSSIILRGARKPEVRHSVFRQGFLIQSAGPYRGGGPTLGESRQHRVYLNINNYSIVTFQRGWYLYVVPFNRGVHVHVVLTSGPTTRNCRDVEEMRRLWAFRDNFNRWRHICFLLVSKARKVYSFRTPRACNSTTLHHKNRNNHPCCPPPRVLTR